MLNPSNSLIAKTGLHYLMQNFAVPPSTALPSISLSRKFTELYNNSVCISHIPVNSVNEVLDIFTSLHF